MRKYFLSIVALVGMLFATSCQESLVEPQLGGTTTFTVQVPDQMGTKAIGGHDLVDKLYVEVYAQGATENVIYETTAGKEQDGSFKVSMNLIQDQHYSIIFWAQKEGAYEVGDLRNIPMNVSHHNNESGAAFYAYLGDFVPSGTTQTVTLKRPFAQLNLGTTPASLKTDVQSDSLILFKSYIKVGNIATSFNTVKGYGEGSQPVEFLLASVPADEKLYVAGEKYYYVSMDYLPIAGDNEALVTVNATITLNNENGPVVSHDFTNVPVKENYRTNIVGNLISSTTDFNVVVDDKFVDENGDNVSDDYNMLIWDGESIKVPSYDETTSTYSISNGAELAWLAATVSGDPLTRSENTPNSLAGKTVKLTEDIYLGENEWKPIGMGGKHFEGIFDGQGHTIYGLKVASRSSGDRAALFCSAAGNAQFKDFTIDGAKIIYPGDGDDYYAAGVVGTIYGNLTFENITVKNSRITGNNKVAGLIAHDGSSTQITIDNCHILDSYIASEDLEDGGCVGGMIGYYATGQAGKENNISNSSVEGCTIIGVNSSNSGKRANSEFIGSIKTKADMVLNITDCILEGNTFTQTINGTDPVTYLSAFNPQYIGGDREEKTLGTITISINGETPAVKVTTIEQLQQVVNNATSDITVELGANITGNVTVIQKPGVKITIDGSKDDSNDGSKYKYNGSIKVHSNSNYYTDAALTIKNLNFETSIASVNFIEALENGSERYSCNITVEDCTFTATGAAENTAVGVQIKASKNAKVIGCTATNMHSLIQATSCDESVLVQGSTVTGKNGVAFKQVKNAVVEGNTITAVEYGIRFDGNTDNYGITVKDNNVTAVQPLIVRKMTGQNNTITLEGTNTFITEAEYQIVITNGSDDEEYVKPTGTYTLTTPNTFTIFPKPILAKVGNTEYDNIDDAIEAWTNNTTLTLLADVTLSDVVTLNSTEHHILDLSTFTMTAASGKNAFVIKACGTGDAERTAITIKADATNPGGVNAGSKSIIYYKYADGGINGNDRPIIKIEGGIFTGSTSSWGTAGIYVIGSAARKAATINISGGTFNCTINGSGKSKLLISGGVFHYSVGSQGDSTALRLIWGGRFKSFGFMTADDNNTKFWIGTTMATSNVGVYVDKDGYLVVGGPVITEAPGINYEKKSYKEWNSAGYLKYSSAAEYGLYYEK